MEKALKEVTDGSLTVRRAALEFNVPKSTLHDRLTGKVLPGAVGGAPRYLDDDEEEELVRWLIGCAEVGYAKSIRDVRAIVGAIVAKKLNVEHATVSHGWWDRFRQRHPNLTLRAGESLSYIRAASTNRVIIDKYFDLLEDILSKNCLTSSRIFNLDESGIPLQHRPGKRIAARGQKHVNVVTSGNKTNITVLACVSASGYVMPPMVIFNRKNLTPELTRGEVEGTIYGLSSSGWIDSELFSDWFLKHFLEYAPTSRPLLLLLDGHSSHYCPEFIRQACDTGVIVFCLPPHSTHVSQPLDASCFHALKSYWDEACDHYMSKNPGKIVTVYNFTELFATAWYKAMTPQNIMSGFRTTGVYPVNRHAIVLPGERPHDHGTPTAALAKKRGIHYMPFFSPSAQFTQEEIELYKHRYEEGFDLTHDSRYNQWVKLNHPVSESLHPRTQLFAESNGLSPTHDSTQSPVLVMSDEAPADPPSPSRSPSPNQNSQPHSKLSEFLIIPDPPAKKASKEPTGVCLLFELAPGNSISI